MVSLLAATVAAAIRWRLDVLGLAVGPVLTYAWVGLVNALGHGPAALIEQIVIVAVALTVTGIALWRHGSGRVRSSGSGADAGVSAGSR